jgi:hypothetical protein
MHSRHMSAAVSLEHRVVQAACPGCTDDTQMWHHIQYIWQTRYNEVKFQNYQNTILYCLVTIAVIVIAIPQLQISAL